MNNNVIRTIDFLCCLLLVPLSGLHAENPVDSTYSRNIISINLASPFDANFQRYRVGYTYVADSKWSYSIDIGFGKYGIMPDSSHFTHRALLKDYRLWELRTEARFYFLEIRKYITPYAALEIYYIHHTQTMHDDGYLPANDSITVYYEQADYLRQKYGINSKLGVIMKFNSYIAAEFYAGIGLRARKNSYRNVTDQLFGRPKWFDDLNYYYYEGTKWSMNITFGLKLNFMF